MEVAHREYTEGGNPVCSTLGLLDNLRIQVLVLLGNHCIQAVAGAGPGAAHSRTLGCNKLLVPRSWLLPNNTV